MKTIMLTDDEIKVLTLIMQKLLDALERPDNQDMEVVEGDILRAIKEELKHEEEE